MLVSTTPPRGAVWAGPLSLAATYGIEVSLFSSGYLDVSVPQVSLHTLCIQAWISRLLGKGFPIGRSQDRRLVSSSPGLIAGSDVLHRHSTPRHPPHALGSLITPTSNRSGSRRGHPLRHQTPQTIRQRRTSSSRVLETWCCPTAETSNNLTIHLSKSNRRRRPGDRTDHCRFELPTVKPPGKRPKPPPKPLPTSPSPEGCMAGFPQIFPRFSPFGNARYPENRKVPPVQDVRIFPL